MIWTSLQAGRCDSYLRNLKTLLTHRPHLRTSFGIWRVSFINEWLNQLVGTKIFWWSEVPASVAGGELSGIAGRYITRDTRTLVHYSRHRPQWPVTKSQEINVFGRCLNILHTFPRGNSPNCKSLKVQKIESLKPWKFESLIPWKFESLKPWKFESPKKNFQLLTSCHCLRRVFSFHFLIMVIGRAARMIISMIEIHCIPAHDDEEAFQMQMSD